MSEHRPKCHKETDTNYGKPFRIRHCVHQVANGIEECCDDDDFSQVPRPIHVWATKENRYNTRRTQNCHAESKIKIWILQFECLFYNK